MVSTFHFLFKNILTTRLNNSLDSASTTTAPALECSDENNSFRCFRIAGKHSYQYGIAAYKGWIVWMKMLVQIDKKTKNSRVSR